MATIRPHANIGQRQVIYLYGAKNELAAVCVLSMVGGAPVCKTGDLRFAGRLIRQNGEPVAVDRVGTVVANPVPLSLGTLPGRYYGAFGEQVNASESPPVFPGNTHFATLGCHKRPLWCQ